MTKLGEPFSGQLTDYGQIYSPEGLLLRYARGRVRNLLGRLAFILAAGVLLWGMVSPELGLLTLGLIVLSEIGDCLYLRRVPQLLRQGQSLRRIEIMSTLTASVQAMTISVCAGMSWVMQHDHTEPLFAIGMLISAAINGGVVLPYHRRATIARLSIYGAAPLAMIGMDLWSNVSTESHYQMNLAGLAMLYASVLWFMKFVSRNFDRNRGHVLAQEDQRQQLETANARLQEQQLQARRLALVAKHANDSVILIDRDGYIIWANEAFTQITGFTFSEAVGQRPRNLMDVINTDPEALQKLVESRRIGQPLRIKLRSRRKDGSLMWLETNQAAVLDQNGNVEMFIAVERDVTLAHQHEQEMEQARCAAEDGERTKAEFLATMSHEIRTPMNGVVGMAQMLEATQLDTEQRLYTDTILSSSKTLLALINDVLDLSKLDAQKMSFSRVDFDLRACFQETLRLFQVQTDEKGLRLVLDLPDSLPDWIHGDDRRIRQILLNLVGNAIKFTASGEVRVCVDIQAQEDVLALTFEVHDTGIGIARDKLDHVFERFSQAEAATTRRFGGTGLGLTISRKLTEAMGGEIRVTSELGTGSCFTVTLGLTVGQAPADLRPHNTDSLLKLDQIRAGLRVLVAEDNKVNRLVMQKFLRDAPIELLFAHDGHEAVEQAQVMNPDLVFMDMSMPVMNGIDATRAIRRAKGPQPVIVALTANAFDSDREACLQAGMDEFLSKPLNRSDVLAVLQRYGGSG